MYCSFVILGGGCRQADYLKIIIVVAIRFFMAVNQRINFHIGISYSTVIDISLMHRLLVVLGIRFRESFVLVLRRLRRRRVSFYVLISPHVLATPRGVFRRLTTWCLVIPRVGTDRRLFIVIGKRWNWLDCLLARKSGVVLLFRYCYILFMPKSRHRRHKQIWD